MSFRNQLQWTCSPLINAPMGGFAGPKLAAAVSREGGLGMIDALMDPQILSHQLAKASELLSGVKSNGTLPIGVGFLLVALTGKRSAMIKVLRQYQPAVVWLFAEPHLSDYNAWATEIREALPQSQLWIQTCSVTSALELARSAKPDVLVMQGNDAGGHGWERCAGIISLVPETRDALVMEGFSIAVAASGGIMEGRGAAAAFALGAEAVIMGTRFLASKEIDFHPLYQQQILDTHDAGQHTIRSKLFDELKGPNIWPPAYDGRALVSESYEDYSSGVHMDQIRERPVQAVVRGDGGWGSSQRAAV